MERLPHKYRVSLGQDGAVAPWLLKSFTAWLESKTYGSIGCFAIDIRIIPYENVLVFAALPNERQLAIDVSTGAVILRWASGSKEIAKTFAAFLARLSESNTGIIALDVGDCDARAELVRWLHVSTPPVRPRSSKLNRDTEPVQTSR